MTRYRCVDDQKAAGFPVTAACEAAGVSTSGYYDWCRPGGGRADRASGRRGRAGRVDARDLRRRPTATTGCRACSRRLRKAGLVVNRKRVARLMRLHGMAGRLPAPHVSHHVPRPRRLPDPRPRRPPLRRPAPPMSPGAKTSPTSPPARAGCTWRRCSTSGRGGCWATRWPTTCAPSSSSTRSAWPSPPAAATSRRRRHRPRRPRQRSTPRTTTSTYCQDRQMRPSVGRTGVCWDNAVAESFWESLKRECIQGRRLRHPRRGPPGDLQVDQLVQHDPGSTAPSTTSRPSNGNSSTSKRHNHPSARRGDAQIRASGCEGRRTVLLYVTAELRPQGNEP